MSRGEMIPCDHVIAKLWEYIDGGLSEDRKAEVEAHIDICAHCFPEYNFRRAYRTFLQQVEPQSMPSDMRRRVFDAMLEEERKSASAGATPAATQQDGGVARLFRRLFGRG